MQLPEGCTWRKKKDGTYFKFIYFRKQYRGHRVRGSSGTSDPKEAEKRLRKILTDIDNREIYGLRKDRTFREAAKKLLLEFQGSERTLKIYAAQADLLDKWIGHDPLRIICKDRLRPFIASRKVSARSINLSLEFVRLVLRKAAYYWREDGLSWIESCPIIPFESGKEADPYPLSWDEQETFFDLLPGKLRRIALFDVNTGLRDRTLVSLSWDWEKYEESIKETVFQIPGEFMKNGKPFTLILNRIARGVVESQRGQHPELVFGKVHHVTNKAWQKAWKDAGLPMGKDFKKGVHNLRHTFGKRLRDANVAERDIQDLLHHVPKNVTRIYSAPELVRLKEAVEKIVPEVRLVAQKLHTV